MSLFISRFKGLHNELFCIFVSKCKSFQPFENCLGNSSIIKTKLHLYTGNVVSAVHSKGLEPKGHHENIPNSREINSEINKKIPEDLLIKFQQQVKSLSSIMKCDEAAANDLLLKFPFLQKNNISSISSKVSTLLGAGIAKEELMNDMWILTYSLPKLKKQIQLVQDMNCDPIKPWHLRCSKEVFNRLSQNKEINRLALSPYQSVTDYICKRLELTEDQVHLFASRHPPVMRVKVAKLKEIIDYLYSEGFTSHQIYNTPRILCHSLNTIQERLAVLKSNNHKPYSLFVLCKSKNKFDDFLKNLRPPES